MSEGMDCAVCGGPKGTYHTVWNYDRFMCPNDPRPLPLASELESPDFVSREQEEVEDLVAFSLAILKRYAPGALADFGASEAKEGNE